jgi:uncharacterized MAPEG superfamily protein
MTTPQWVLLGFALWTIFLLTATIGVYRWTLIFSGKTPKEGFPGDSPHGADWYGRATRAHANCVENLPVYGALVLLLTVRGLDTPTLDTLALAVLAGGLLQSLTHISFPLIPPAVMTRFGFFFVQLIAMFWMAWIIAVS